MKSNGQEKEKDDHGGPLTLVQSLYQFISTLPSPYRQFVVILVLIVGAAFAIWNTLPDKTKTEILSFLGNNKTSVDLQKDKVTSTPPISKKPTINLTLPYSKTKKHSKIREKSARQLLDYLDSLPPLHAQTVIENSYLRRRVVWEGQVKSILLINNVYLIGMLESDGSGPWTFISFSNDWRDQIESIRKEDLIRFEGIIERVGQGEVDLVAPEMIESEGR